MAFLLAAALVAADAGAADFALARSAGPIVLRATGRVAQEVTIGRPLPRQSAFGLSRGDILSLLDIRGLRVLKGPGVLQNGKWTQTGKPEVDRSVLAVVAELVTDDPAPQTKGFSLSRPSSGGPTKPAAQGGERTRVGAVRNEPRVPENSSESGIHALQPDHDKLDDIWFVDLADSDVICLPAGAQPILYRSKVDGALAVTLSQGSASNTWSFETGSRFLDWPLYFTAPGQSYSISYADRPASQIKVEALALEPSGDGNTAIDVLPARCQAQVDLNLRLRGALPEAGG